MELLDRSRYRMCEDSKLLEEARYNPNAELAIVLAERLEAVWVDFEGEVETLKDRAASFEHEALELDDKIYLLQSEIERNEATIAAMAAQIKEHESSIATLLLR
jgi:predicted  nucleic acid-binding Zn-ribbon protein